MLSDDELVTLMQDLESDRVERTTSTRDGEKYRIAVCAFANDLADHRLPGVLFVGVDDNGCPTDIPITDQLLLKLADMKTDGNVLPVPSLSVQKRRLLGHDVAVVEVPPADAPPVRYRGQVWIRVGPRRAVASAEDERRLNEKRRFRDAPADLRPVHSASLDDLDELLFRRVYLPAAVAPEVLAANQRSIADQYLASRFAQPGEPPVPTLLGILIVGKDPTYWCPGAYVQFVRFAGTELTDPIQDQLEVRGPLPDIVQQLEGILKLNVRVPIEIVGSPTEVRRPDYPLAALQQIVRNAILHRSYESTNAPVRLYWFADRVEVHNPGGPFGLVTMETFGKVCDYRNPTLASAFKDLGYIQRFGVGLQIAREELERNGNPEIEYVLDPSYVTVIVRGRQ